MDGISHQNVLKSWKLLILATLFSSFALASKEVSPPRSVPASWTPETVPNPVKTPELCGIEQPGRVCDPNFLLDPDTRKEIQEVIASIEVNCTHPCGGRQLGYQLAVVMLQAMDRTQLPSPNDKYEAAKAFAIQLGDRWGVGHKSCNDGIILVVSKADRVAYLRTAVGSREALPDKIVQQIIDRIVGEIKRTKGKSFDKALLGGAAYVLLALQGKEIPSHSDGIGDYAALFPFLVVLGFFALPCIIPCIYLACFSAFLCIAYPIAFAIDAGSFCIYSIKQRCCLGYRAASPHAASEAEEDVRAREALGRIRREMERSEEENSAMCVICLEDLRPSNDDHERPSAPPLSSSLSPTSSSSSPPPPPHHHQVPKDYGTTSEEKEANSSSNDAYISIPASSSSSQQPIATLPCGHTFHRECIIDWVQSRGSGNATCPLCRAQIPHNWRAGEEMKEIKRGDNSSVSRRGGFNNTQRLTAMLERLQERFPNFGGGRRAWQPSDAAAHICSRGGRRGLTNRNQYGYNGLNNGGDDWLYYYWLTQPRIASYDGIGVVNNLPNVSNAIETAMTMSRSIQAAIASSSSSGGGGGGSSFGGGGGFSGGGGAGGGW